MISNKEKGEVFERQVGDYLKGNGIEVKTKYKIEVGIQGRRKRSHEFDWGNERLLVECKKYTWTKTGNNPSAKLSTANEALLYLLAAPESYQKMLFMLETHRMGKRNPETLAERYVRKNEHLFAHNLEVFELNEDSLSVRQLWPLPATPGDAAEELQAHPQDGDKERCMNYGSVPDSYRRDSMNSERASLLEVVWNEVIDHWFTPARNRGEKEVGVVSGEVHKRLGWSNRYPSVCNALMDRKGKLAREARVILVQVGTPNPSSTTRFTYRFL